MREIWALIVLTVGNDDRTCYLPWEMVGAMAGVARHPQCLATCFNPMSDNYLRLYQIWYCTKKEYLAFMQELLGVSEHWE